MLHSRFAQMGTFGIRHLIFDPVITLARSGEMTAGFSDRDAIYPVDTIRENHIDLIIPLPNIKDQASEP